jgi:plastocyanin
MNRSRVGRIGASVGAIVLFGVAATGCGDDGKSTPASATTPATMPASAAGASGGAPGALMIKDFKFTPEPMKAKVGDTITVTNADDTNHTATADDKSFDTQSFMGEKTFTVSKAGTIKYHCAIHTYMTGTIEVAN